jgi:exopolysaccharide biosynthesis polyprenyl glycosylphosphotransferase
MNTLIDITGGQTMTQAEEISIGQRAYLLTKRAIDIIGASGALLMLAPLLVGVAIAIKLTSPGPVFFRQKRVGHMGELFEMLKFRSMRQDADRLKQQLMEQNEATGPAFKMKNDPRITPIGRFIRKYSIDELPQLWHVLMGTMSLVGPRPVVPEEAADYQEWHRKRFEVKPGLTCIWQVQGRSDVTFDEWMRMDVEYVETRSLMLDLTLLVKTVPAVLTGRGAY